MPRSGKAVEKGQIWCLENDKKRAHLHKEQQIGILALGGGTGALLDVVLGDVDALRTVITTISMSARCRTRRAHHLGCLPDRIFGRVDGDTEA